MDDSRFDTLSRALVTGHTRRGLGGCWVVSRSADRSRYLGWLRRKPSTRSTSTRRRKKKQRRGTRLPHRRRYGDVRAEPSLLRPGT